MLSLKRLGWSSCEESSFIDNKGTMLTLDEYGPREIKTLVERSAQDWTWKQVAQHRPAFSGVDSTPFLAPIKRALAAPCTPRWSAAAKGWLRSLCADAWDDSETVCPLCQAPMSPWHACWDCPAVMRFQVDYGLSEGLAACARRGASDPLFSCLIVPHPAADYPSPLHDPHQKWISHESSRLADGEEIMEFRGYAFGDGSGVNPRSYRTRRCGWAVASEIVRFHPKPAMGEGDSGALVATYGALPGAIQEVPIAELYAFMVAMTYAMPDGEGCFSFYTDCLWVVNSYKNGAASCTAANHVGAALWTKVYRLIDDRFPNRSQVRVLKVKAHTSISDCEGSIDLLWLRAGNEMADKGAKTGAAFHPSEIEMLEAMVDHDQVLF